MLHGYPSLDVSLICVGPKDGTIGRTEEKIHLPEDSVAFPPEGVNRVTAPKPNSLKFKTNLMESNGGWRDFEVVYFHNDQTSLTQSLCCSSQDRRFKPVRVKLEQIWPPEIPLADFLVNRDNLNTPTDSPRFFGNRAPVKILCYMKAYGPCLGTRCSQNKLNIGMPHAHLLKFSEPFLQGLEK